MTIELNRAKETTHIEELRDLFDSLCPVCVIGEDEFRFIDWPSFQLMANRMIGMGHELMENSNGKAKATNSFDLMTQIKERA